MRACCLLGLQRFPFSQLVVIGVVFVDELMTPARRPLTSRPSPTAFPRHISADECIEAHACLEQALAYAKQSCDPSGCHDLDLERARVACWMALPVDQLRQSCHYYIAKTSVPGGERLVALTLVLWRKLPLHPFMFANLFAKPATLHGSPQSSPPETPQQNMRVSPPPIMQRARKRRHFDGESGLDERNDARALC